jgi:hypothetical protein
MTTKEYWLTEVQKRLDRIKSLQKRKEPRVDASTLQKLVDDTRRSMLTEVKELAAASQILYDEMLHEGKK